MRSTPNLPSNIGRGIPSVHAVIEYAKCRFSPPFCVTIPIAASKLRVVTAAPTSAGQGETATLPTAMIFVDGTNLDRTCVEKLGRNDIDFEKLLPLLATGTQLLRTCYVTAPYKRELDEMRYRVQTGMLNHLRRMPNVVVDLQQHRFRESTCKRCGFTARTPREKGTDVSVASFLVEAAVSGAADELILVANDADYAPAVKLARKYRKRLALAYVLGPDEREFQVKLRLATVWNHCNRFIRLDLEAMNSVWMPRRK